MKILSISTDQELSELRKFALEAVGHDVTALTSEKDALRVAEERSSFDAVFVCHHLPAGTARQIIRLLRKSQPTATIIYIVHLYGEWPEVEADRYVAGADGPAALVRVINEIRSVA